MKNCELCVTGINPETKLKLKLLSATLKKPMVRLVEEMIEALWLKYENTTPLTVSQNRINKETRKILEKNV